MRAGEGAVVPESEQGMMSAVPTMRRDDPADDDLAGTWAWLFGTALGRPVRLLAFRREPCQFATLFPAERVSLVLDTGREVSLFVKHMGGEQADYPDKRRRDRETLVYEELLAGDHDLPVARYYGTRLNRATGRREVYLEFVDDWSLKYHGLEHWFAAARALARLHARFATRAPRLAACDFLLRLDEQYLRAWAERALAAVARKSAGFTPATGVNVAPPSVEIWIGPSAITAAMRWPSEDMCTPVHSCGLVVRGVQVRP